MQQMGQQVGQQVESELSGFGAADGIDAALEGLKERVSRVEKNLAELESLNGRDYRDSLRVLLAELKACRAGAGGRSPV